MTYTPKDSSESGDFLRIRDVSDKLDVSDRSVWRLVEDGQLPVHKFGSSTRIRRKDLDAYIDRCRYQRNKVDEKRDEQSSTNNQRKRPPVNKPKL